MDDSWSPPTNWLVRSSPRLQSPQLGSSDGEHSSSSLRSAQSILPSQRDPRDTQPPPYWHWKSEAPQPQANSSSPSPQSLCPSQTAVWSMQLPSEHRNWSEVQEEAQATSSSPSLQSDLPSHFHSSGMQRPLRQANSPSSQLGKPQPASSWPPSQSCSPSHT